MLAGVHEVAPPAATVKAFPAMAVGREFYPNVVTAAAKVDLGQVMAGNCTPFWRAGKLVVWSFKPSPKDVTSGALKPTITALAQYIQQNGLTNDVVLCPWHEPENDFANPTLFVGMFNTVNEWLKAVDPRILTTHAALGYYYRNTTAAMAAHWLTNADVHSIDLYSGRSFPLAMTLPTSQAFLTWKAALPPSARWAVTERGFIAKPADSAARVKAINAEADYLASLPELIRPEWYILWNTPGTENDTTIPLDAAARTAMCSLFDRVAH